MTGPSENSEFCFPLTSMFPSASPRGTLSVSGKQNSLFPLWPVIKCLLNNAVNYGESGARKRRRNNTEHCHEAKPTWAIGKEAFKYTTTQMSTDSAFPSLKFARQDAVQPCKKSYMIRWSQEKSNVSVCLVKLQNSEHSGKMWLIPWSVKKNSSVQSSQLLHPVSAWRKIQSWPK